ncbi:type II toxin-antitoxin system PemK/MazF family toxin [Gloeocapsa sp. BRSZ]
MTYSQFDVVVVPFPFTDISATKRRPALVLSNEIFNTPSHRSVMAMITTASHSPWVLDVAIADLASTGLKAASVVRMKLFTLDDSIVVKQIGILAQTDKLAVQKALQLLFAIA